MIEVKDKNGSYKYKDWQWHLAWFLVWFIGFLVGVISQHLK